MCLTLFQEDLLLICPSKLIRSRNSMFEVRQNFSLRITTKKNNIKFRNLSVQATLALLSF